MASYQSKLSAWEGFEKFNGPVFWQAWEMQYLGRRLVDRADVANHLQDVHRKLAARYGDYLA